MIYICKGCAAICKAPCQACDALCKGCSGIFDGCCKCIGDIFNPISTNPLGGLVLGTWATMGIVLLLAGTAFSKLGEEDACSSSKVLTLAILAMAIIHALAVYYLQRRLVTAIGKEGSNSMTSKEIATMAGKVMLYDFGFCFYVIFFVGSFFYTCAGFGGLSACESAGMSWGAAVLLVVYQLFAWNYGMCWYCGHGCCGQFEKATGNRHGGGTPATVGAAHAPAHA